MARKAKEENINLFYLNDNKIKQQNTKKRVNKKKKATPKREKKKTNKNEGKSTPKNDDIFNFDNEIVIGVTRFPSEEEKKRAKIKEQKKLQKKKNKKLKKQQKEAQMKKLTKEQKKKLQKRKKIIKRIKWTGLIACMIGSFIFLITSPIFNVLNIEVKGNEKITTEEIISLSQIQTDQNIFKMTKGQITNNIKENAYIATVEIKRKLPSTIELTVKERTPKYMLQYVNGYVYFSSQGYILEISDEKLEILIIKGVKTKEEDIVPGKRLCVEDLEKLETVLKISNVLANNELDKKVTTIDITDINDYLLYVESEKKTIHLGNSSNLSNKIVFAKAIMEKNQNIEGEIFVNNNLNETGTAYFKQKV